MSPAYQNVFLLLAVLAPTLPPVAAAPLLAVLIALWWSARPPARELVLGLPFLAVAAGWLAFQAFAGVESQRDRLVAAAAHLEERWQDLEAAAVSGAGELARDGGWQGDERQAFRRLEDLSGRSPAEATWYLLDGDGVPVAWSGPGLLQDLEAGESPAVGRSLRAGHTSLTLLATASVGEDPAGDRLVVGRSLPTRYLPGEDPEGVAASWALDSAPTDDPGVVIGPGPLHLVPRQPWGGDGAPPGRDLPPYLIAAGLVLVGLSRLRRDPAASAAPLIVLATASPLLAGVALLADAAEVERWAIASLLVGVAAALVAHPLGRRGRSPWIELVAGAAIAAFLAAASRAAQLATGALDLGAELVGPAHEAAVRLAFFLITLSALRLLPLAEVETRRRSRWAWLSVLALGLGAVFHGLPSLGIAALTVAVVCAVAWCRRLDAERTWSSIAVLCLLAAMIAALGWEIEFHDVLERDLRREVMAELVPPTPAELEAVRRELDEHFAALGPGLGVAATDGAEEATIDPAAGDLAYALWRGSPLAREGRLSALTVWPAGRPVATFSYGLPLDATGALDVALPAWDEVVLPGWEEALVGGRVPRRDRVEAGAAGAVGAPIGYWVMLRPGFRTASARFERVAEGLLRGGPVGLSTAELLPGDVRLGLYSPSGSVLVAPWRGAPDLESAEGPPPVVRTELFDAHTIATRAEEGWRVLYLPIPPAQVGLERIATHAVGPLLALAATLVLAVATNIGRPALAAALSRAWRSYSQRLLILYTVILVVPVVLGNLFLLRLVGQELARQERDAGEAALEAAQRVLGEYALTLDPGFQVETAFDDELLLWLSRVLEREVNLYWGSEVYASSKPELFTAGLLPSRIPGEIYRRLALEGSNLASRTSRAGGASSYQESYAPFRVPGAPTVRPNLFLSTPLLAQEVERASEMAAIRRRIVLVTSLLVFLLAALGTRLARRFTEPLMGLVDGTQRIAGGAASLGFRPQETELATLAGAIDEMAGKIADGRARLLAEKQVVDTVVENIKAGVVSVDADGRVLLLNRRGRELLGLEVGAPLVEQLAARPAFAPVADFLRRVADEPAQKTLRIGGMASGDSARDDGSEWTVVWVPVPGSTAPAAILVLEDVSEVLRGQRLEAWAEMARMIAHEIKNPLTPIRLSAEHLKEVYSHRREALDDIFERCIDNILLQVEELRVISSEFSTYSHIPRADLQPGDLAATVEEIVEAYRAAPGGVQIEWRRPGREVAARFDERLLGRAVRNLLENAMRAVAGKGRIEVALETNGQRADLTVADSGPGVEPDLLRRIFEPYFSTDDSGTGLGLPIARKIIEEHGGTIQARNRSAGGLSVLVTLPLAAAV